MHLGKRIGVAIPAYDVADWIEAVLVGLPEWVDLVVVVDDASRDDTAALAAATIASTPSLGRRAHLVSHPVNRGVGAAITTGYAKLLALGVDVAVVMAGDGQMDPEDLPRLLAPVIAGTADYAKGDRFSHRDVWRTMPTGRHLAGLALSFLTAKAAGLASLSDSQSGYTAISAGALERIDCSRMWPRYGYPNDLIGMLALSGLRIVDVPIRPVYRGEKSGLRAWHLATIGFLIGRVAARRALARSRFVRSSASVDP